MSGKSRRICCKCMTCRGKNSAIATPAAEVTSAMMRRTCERRPPWRESRGTHWPGCRCRVRVDPQDRHVVPVAACEGGERGDADGTLAAKGGDARSIVLLDYLQSARKLLDVWTTADLMGRLSHP